MTAASFMIERFRYVHRVPKGDHCGNTDDGSLSPLTFTHGDNSWTVITSVPS